MDDLGRAYLGLALSLEGHFAGFVDAYFGPPELKPPAGEVPSLEALGDDARQLLAAVERGEPDAQRKDFFQRQVRAMAAVIRSLSGERLDFVEEVELYFDIRPEMVAEEVFAAAHAEMDRLLPGDGSLVERLAAWKKRLELAPDRILPVFDLARQETRRRTAALFPLPPGEDVTLHVVHDQPWSAYNWYLGGYQSRIDLNDDLPLRVDAAVPLLAHEAYAGHHTEHAIKEYRLYRQQGRAEHAVQLLLAPECVLAEGIGDSAQELLFDQADLADFLRHELYPRAGFADVPVETQVCLSQVGEGLRAVSGNAALLLHREGRPPEEVQRYVERWALRTPKEAAQTLKFLQNPLFRSYVFNYALGKELIRPLLQGPDAKANFQRLLSEAFTPSQVRQWIAQECPGSQ
jgi:hypothetical protein